MEPETVTNDIISPPDNSGQQMPMRQKVRMLCKENTLLIQQINNQQRIISRFEIAYRKLELQISQDDKMADQLRQRIDELTAQNEELTELTTAQIGEPAMLKIQRRQQNQQILQRQVQSLKNQNHLLLKQLQTYL